MVQLVAVVSRTGKGMPTTLVLCLIRSDSSLSVFFNFVIDDFLLTNTGFYFFVLLMYELVNFPIVQTQLGYISAPLQLRLSLKRQ